ncbi:MAG: type II secretion system F family protein [Actinomycetota bacterium]
MIAAAMLLAACCAVLVFGGVGAPVRRLEGALGVPAQPARRPRERAVGVPFLVFAVIGTVYAARAGPPMTALIAISLVSVRLTAQRRHSRATRRAAAAAVPDACRTLAAELSAGAVPADALAAAAGGCPELLAGVLRAAAFAESLGAPAASVLARPPDGCEALRAVAVCWEVCLNAGCGLGPAMDRLAAVFAAELEASAVIDAELAGVRLSAAVMACLPIFGLALGAALGSDPLQFLFGTPAGRIVLSLAAALDCAGVWWIGRLARGAAR